MMGSTKKPNSTDSFVGIRTEHNVLAATTKTLTTYRSSSTSMMMSVRPKTLNVKNPREAPTTKAKFFISEALNAWRAKARCSVVPAERVQELFHELQFNPSERQISEMLQAAKMFARKGSRQWHGLTFGEFCVLAADLKRFRTPSFSLVDAKVNLNYKNTECATGYTPEKRYPSSIRRSQSTKTVNLSEERSSKSNTKVNNSTTEKDCGKPVEVFLGGSCNPTTWRKDVAIPALEKLGISFYNPQVSDWTPDLIELEHRAKEKARVLFFVMDSETRASAGAIEAAHIAGQNCKQLVLVLHPYRPDQYILNEPISYQEYIDLTRNQQILRELVTRRGLPVLEDIPSGLQRTKEILAGISDPPSNVASILKAVRGAFDRVNCVNNSINLGECRRALLILGYTKSLLNLENLKEVIQFQNEFFELFRIKSSMKTPSTGSNDLRHKNQAANTRTSTSFDSSKNEININFDQFCVLAAYLSVLQQEIDESGCISPIKGTNVPPPPVYLTNLQGFNSRPGDETVTINYTKHFFRMNSNVFGEEHFDIGIRNRDSGTSSPLPDPAVPTHQEQHEVKPESVTKCPEARSSIELLISTSKIFNSKEEESDSNDSVFSSDSSINSLNCSGESANQSFEIRDVYLGGSCYLRSKWRQDYAVPYLKSKSISYHLPSLHESIQPPHCEFSDRLLDDTCTNIPLNKTKNLYNPSLIDSSRVLLFVITNETRSLAPMTLAAHCIGLMYNIVLCVQMLPEQCVIGDEKLTVAATKDYNRGRSYLIDLAKRQGVPVFSDLKSALECTVDKVNTLKMQKRDKTYTTNVEERNNCS